MLVKGNTEKCSLFYFIERCLSLSKAALRTFYLSIHKCFNFTLQFKHDSHEKKSTPVICSSFFCYSFRTNIRLSSLCRQRSGVGNAMVEFLHYGATVCVNLLC